MADFPTRIDFNAPVIHSGSIESIGTEITAGNSSLINTTTWPASNLALFMPILISYLFTAKLIFWTNGATVGTNSVDAGIYTSEGNLLVSSGSTLTSGVSVLQSADITDTVLIPGLYYLAMAMNGTTDTVAESNLPTPIPRAVGSYEQTTAFTLPSTATFAVSSRSFMPFIGITSKATL